MTVNPVYRVEYLTGYMPVSEEVLSDASELGEAVQRMLMMPGPVAREEWERRQQRGREERAAERYRSPQAPPVTVERLATRLGFGPKYTEHLMEEYCRCEIVPDSGWERCQHAIDLRIETHD